MQDAGAIQVIDLGSPETVPGWWQGAGYKAIALEDDSSGDEEMGVRVLVCPHVLQAEALRKLAKGFDDIFDGGALPDRSLKVSRFHVVGAELAEAMSALRKLEADGPEAGDAENLKSRTEAAQARLDGAIRANPGSDVLVLRKPYGLSEITIVLIRNRA